jgi:hypothetical protein
VPRHQPEKTLLHELYALQKILQVRAPSLAGVVDRALQVIDRRQEILEEILGAVADRLVPLAQRAAPEVLEIRLEADQAVLGLDQLGREVLDPIRLGAPFGVSRGRFGALGGRRLGAGG